MDMDEQLKELEPLFYSEIKDGEIDQLMRVRDELKKLASIVMEDAIRGGNGKIVKKKKLLKVS